METTTVLQRYAVECDTITLLLEWEEFKYYRI